MKVTLRDIDQSNWRACMGMKDQPYVASNVYSIAETKVFPRLRPMCIYHDGEPVGFVMYGPSHSDEHDGEIMVIHRLMIVEERQGRGYGSGAVRQVLEMVRKLGTWREVYISTSRDNVSAARLYERLGFAKTGDMWDEEEIFVFDLEQLG
jgi:diamine N-acetyltransferase